MLAELLITRADGAVFRFRLRSSFFLIFRVTFNMQASIAWVLGLFTRHFNQGNGQGNRATRAVAFKIMAERSQSWNFREEKYFAKA